MTPPPGRSAPGACSVMWDGALDATAYGTAAPATFWVGLEQPGPWGRAALTQSRLPAGVGSRLGTACTSRGGRLALLEEPAHGEEDRREAGEPGDGASEQSTECGPPSTARVAACESARTPAAYAAGSRCSTE